MQEAPKLIMNSIDYMVQWYHDSLKHQKSLSNTEISSIDEQVWSKTFMVCFSSTNCWCKMAKSKRLTFLPNSLDQVKVPMRKSTKRFVKSIPGYMKLLKDFDDSKYHSMTIQKYSNT